MFADLLLFAASQAVLHLLRIVKHDAMRGLGPVPEPFASSWLCLSQQAHHTASSMEEV
jgi:hypothetical protein